MKALRLSTGLLLTAACGAAVAQTADPRLREVQYDPHAVVTVQVQRGVVTHVLLDAEEAITEVASGQGSDCTKPEAAWCVAAQAGGRSIFVKPKSSANASDNLAVVTDRRTYAFRFVLVPEGSATPPVYRLVVKAPIVRKVLTVSAPHAEPLRAISPPATPSPEKILAERLKAAPHVVNSNYSVAEGQGSGDIAPTLVFDDGRFTYFRFPGNREIPAVFHVLGDGSETLVNTRMEGDLLVVDRVSRRLMLRAGSAVVGVWNEAFDIEGVPPSGGTTVAGAERIVRSEAHRSTSGEMQ
jgi:type IV secretion system protein VirB9